MFHPHIPTPPPTANSTSADCVENRPGPSVQNISLGVYRAGCFKFILYLVWSWTLSFSDLCSFSRTLWYFEILWIHWLTSGLGRPCFHSTANNAMYPIHISDISPSHLTKLKWGYTGFNLSVFPCMDRMVSALHLQQYSPDPLHTCTHYQATS